MAAAAALAAGAVPLAAQAAPAPTHLAPPDATLHLELTRVGAVRELSTGRVLVLDAGDVRLWLADLTEGPAAPVGERGAGPGEYTGPTALFALPADSTLLVDRRQGRWLLLQGGAIVETVAAESPALRSGARAPLGADFQGHVLATLPMRGGEEQADGLPRRDSLWLVRVDRASGGVDTVTLVKARPARISVTGPKGHPTSVNVSINVMAVGEESVLFPDGWVAVARLDPYRVAWYPPAGRPVVGPPLPDERRPLDDDEKRFVLERLAERNGTPVRSPDDLPDWPAIVPPFQAGALLAAPDGSVWIHRTATTDHPETRYDVIDRRGALVRRVTMSDREQVVGLGRRSVYTVVVDDDGIEHLNRHPLPR